MCGDVNKWGVEDFAGLLARSGWIFLSVACGWVYALDNIEIKYIVMASSFIREWYRILLSP